MALTPLLPVLRLAGIGLQVWLIILTVVGFQMGRTLRRLTREAGLDPTWRGILLLTPFSIMLGGGILQVTGIASYVAQRLADTAKIKTFSGGSEALKQTLIVPTLDSPCPPGRSVIWCSSFQLAWNEIRDMVVKAPLEVPEAAELAARLNDARQSVSDVDAGSIYVAAGRFRDGIIGRITKEMAAKFPSHRPPDFNNRPHRPEGILAYSYLTAHMPFRYPFRQLNEGFTFIDSQGVRNPGGWFRPVARLSAAIPEHPRAGGRSLCSAGGTGSFMGEGGIRTRFVPVQRALSGGCRPGRAPRLAGGDARIRPHQIADFQRQPGYEIERRFGGK